MQFRAAIIMERPSALVKHRIKTSWLCHNSAQAKFAPVRLMKRRRTGAAEA